MKIQFSPISLAVSHLFDLILILFCFYLHILCPLSLPLNFPSRVLAFKATVRSANKKQKKKQRLKAEIGRLSVACVLRVEYTRK